MGPWELSARLLPSLSVALLPVVSIWWLASYGTNPVTHYLGFVGLALPIILGASFSGFTSAVVVAVAIAALALVVWAYSYWNGAPLCEALNLDPALMLARASAGQRQKAEFICALASDPAVLLLDETFAHLDQASVAQVCVWLREWSTSRVIIFAHHGESPLRPDATLHIDRQSIALDNQLSAAVVTLPRH